MKNCQTVQLFCSPARILARLSGRHTLRHVFAFDPPKEQSLGDPALYKHVVNFAPPSILTGLSLWMSLSYQITFFTPSQIQNKSLFTIYKEYIIFTLLSFNILSCIIFVQDCMSCFNSLCQKMISKFLLIYISHSSDLFCNRGFILF